MTLYKLSDGANGRPYIFTPTGHLVPIPGAGPEKGADHLAVYRDGDADYWYIDRNNHPVRINAEDVEYFISQTGAPVFKVNDQGKVEPSSAQDPQLQQYKVKHQYEKTQLQLNANQQQIIAQQQQLLAQQNQVIAQQQQALGQQQQSISQQQIVNQQQQQAMAQSQRNQPKGPSVASGIASGAVTAAGAFAGAALGSAMANRWNNRYYYGFPYGRPVFRQRDRFYYYGFNGRPNYFSANSGAAALVNQWSRQRPYPPRVR